MYAFLLEAGLKVILKNNGLIKDHKDHAFASPGKYKNHGTVLTFCCFHWRHDKEDVTIVFGSPPFCRAHYAEEKLRNNT